MNARPINQVVIDRSGGGAERKRLRILLAEVEPAAPSVIEQDSVTAAWSTRGDEEGNTLVQGISRFLKVVRIGVPEGKRLAATIERTGLVAQTEKMLRLREHLAQGKAAAHHVDGAGRGIARDHVARQIRHDH